MFRHDVGLMLIGRYDFRFMIGCPADDGWQAGRHMYGAAARYCGCKVYIGYSRDGNLNAILNEKQKCAALPNVTCISLSLNL